jgi:beta-glucosidase
MKKVKVVLVVLGSLFVALIILGVTASIYLKNTFLDFETEYTALASVEEIQQDGHSFLDLNANERLDVYEDERVQLEKRVSNLLSLMTLEEKIHLLKGSGIGSAIGLNEPGVGIPGAVGTLVATPRLGIPTEKGKTEHTTVPHFQLLLCWLLLGTKNWSMQLVTPWVQRQQNTGLM